MESGFPRSTMDAQRRPSLSALGVRNTQSSEERAEDRERDEATEEREAGLLRQPPMLKLRGRELSLDDYIRENRVRRSTGRVQHLLASSPLCRNASHRTMIRSPPL